MSIYSLANGMREVSVPANHAKNNLPIGTILLMNGYSCPKYAVVKNLGVSPSFQSYGATYLCVELDTYQEQQKQAFSLKLLSEKTDNRIQTYITDDKITPAECLELWEKAQAKKVSDKAKGEAAAKARETQRGQLKRKYPYLAQAGSGVKDRIMATKNIRTELKKLFPRVRFSITSESYSGGDSIRVRWTDGPTAAQVKTVTDKYQEGNFNGMEDIYEHSHRIWNEVFGGARYVFEDRDYARETSEKTLREYLLRTGQAYQGMDFAGYNYMGEMVGSGHTIVWRDLAEVNLI